MGIVNKASGKLIKDNSHTNFRVLPTYSPTLRPSDTKEAKESKLNQQLNYGDLHGNALKLTHFLISQGILKLEENEKRESPETQYQKIVEIFQKKDLDREDLITFKKILENANWKTDKGLLRLLGDLLSDRGAGFGNDYLTLLLLEQLHLNNVPFTILFSNHDSVFFDCLAKNIFSAEVLNETGGTYDRMLRLIDKKYENFDRKSMRELLDHCYFSHLKAIDYVYHANTDPPTLTLFTHAPNGLEIVEELAKSYHIPWTCEEITAEKIKNIIDEINHQFVKDALSGKLFKQMQEETNEIRNLELSFDLVLKKYPLHRLIWNRYFSQDHDLDWGKKLQDGTLLYYVHGHDITINKHTYTHVVGLDNMAGRVDLTGHADSYFENQGTSSKNVELKEEVIKYCQTLRPLNELYAFQYQLSPKIFKKIDELNTLLENESLSSEDLQDLTKYITLATRFYSNDTTSEIEKFLTNLIKRFHEKPAIYKIMEEMTVEFMKERAIRRKTFYDLGETTKEEKKGSHASSENELKELLLQALQPLQKNPRLHDYQHQLVNLIRTFAFYKDDPFDKGHWIEIIKIMNRIQVVNHDNLMIFFERQKFICRLAKIESKIPGNNHDLKNLIQHLYNNRSYYFNNGAIIKFLRDLNENLESLESISISYLHNINLTDELKNLIQIFVKKHNQNCLDEHLNTEEKKEIVSRDTVIAKIKQRDTLFKNQILVDLQILPQLNFSEILNFSDVFHCIHHLIQGSYHRIYYEKYLQQVVKTDSDLRFKTFNQQNQAAIEFQYRLHQFKRNQLEDKNISGLLNDILSRVNDPLEPPVSSYGFGLLNVLLERMLQDPSNCIDTMKIQFENYKTNLHLNELEFHLHQLNEYKEELDLKESEDPSMLVFASKVVYQELEKDFERLKKKETYQKEELKALTDILHHTHDLHQNELTKNKIDVLEQDIKRIPGQPSIGKKLLGAVAVLFGVLLIATSPLTAPYTLGLGFVAGFHIGYHIMMMGMILFGGAAALTGGYFFIQRNELATVTHRLKNVANRELKLKP